ncbi:sensor histidine kinase [Pedobacter sp. GR22-6]|uniref:sensor histidine kinase n=1 Tax=Pedobacter sp. GR22-6 TaxID=3127957 RepID=UPI00307D47FF
MTNALKLLYYKFIGDTKNTILQARIFHQVCVVVLFFLPFAIVSNIFTKVPHTTLAMTTLFLFTAAVYYYSRVHGRLKISTTLFTLFVNGFLATNYFLNSGIQGPTLMLFILSAIFIIAVMPARAHVFWLSFNSITVLSLLSYDFLNPGAIAYTYDSRASLFTDMGFSYIAGTTCIVLIITYILRNYRREKRKAQDASLALGEANEAKIKLLSILSHDLKSPLNSIQGFLELLVAYDLEEHEEKAIKSSLLQETKNTQSMLFNMLNWTKSQMDSGVKVNLEEINIFEALKSSLNAQKTVGQEKNIKIFDNIDPDLHIIADLEMLKLVVRNLINNAIKFTHKGGEINISTALSGDIVSIKVSDNGIGISPEKQDKIFTLNTGATYGTNNEKGVGLGLLLCKEFTELQGGNIQYSSTPGEGSIFEIRFPHCQPKSITLETQNNHHT